MSKTKTQNKKNIFKTYFFKKKVQNILIIQSDFFFFFTKHQEIVLKTVLYNNFRNQFPNTT